MAYRKDNRGRNLERGETQNKDGLYIYSYTNEFGQRKTVKSWRLTESDKVPKGKRPCEPLRKMEKEIQSLRDKGIIDSGLTVLELVDRYFQTKTGVRDNTRQNYKSVRNLLASEAFGYMRIAKVRTSDAKLFLIKLQKENGKGYSSICNIRGVLRPAFQMAVDDDLLLKNPFGFQLVDVVINDSVRREALTLDQERKFLEFVKNDSYYWRYYDAIFILFNTGMRVSEFCGLVVDDIDLKNNTVRIERQLMRTRDMQYYIEEPKTEAGKRTVPFGKEVAEAFGRIVQDAKVERKVISLIDGYSGFLFFDINGKPCVAQHWQNRFRDIRNKYNSIYRVQLPPVTPHVCRHTYCTKMARSGMNPKVLQYLMGHSDISVTFDTYTHLGLEEAQKEMNRIAEETKDTRATAWKNRKKKAL